MLFFLRSTTATFYLIIAEDSILEYLLLNSGVVLLLQDSISLWLVIKYSIVPTKVKNTAVIKMMFIDTRPDVFLKKVQIKGKRQNLQSFRFLSSSFVPRITVSRWLLKYIVIPFFPFFYFKMSTSLSLLKYLSWWLDLIRFCKYQLNYRCTFHHYWNYWKRYYYLQKVTYLESLFLKYLLFKNR